MNKQAVMTIIEKLPAEFSLDDLFERLRFVESVNEGLEDIECNRVYSTAEAREKLARWNR